MLPMLTWALLTSHQRLAGKFGGCVISAQMATCTAGRQLLLTGAMAVVVPRAAAAKGASTTPELPRLPCWHLSGTMRQTMLHLTAW